MRLKGRAAVVTGGSSGIGYATAREFDAEDARVAVFGRNGPALESVRSELSDGLAVAGDVRRTTRPPRPRSGPWGERSVSSASLLPRGIRVNVLSPGPVDTPIFDKMGLPREVLDNREAVLLADVPAKRFGDPREIARAAVFLASSDSSFMAGSELMVDGGHAQT